MFPFLIYMLNIFEGNAVSNTEIIFGIINGQRLYDCSLLYTWLYINICKIWPLSNRS